MKKRDLKKYALLFLIASITAIGADNSIAQANKSTAIVDLFTVRDESSVHNETRFEISRRFGFLFARIDILDSTVKSLSAIVALRKPGDDAWYLTQGDGSIRLLGLTEDDKKVKTAIGKIPDNQGSAGDGKAALVLSSHLKAQRAPYCDLSLREISFIGAKNNIGIINLLKPNMVFVDRSLDEGSFFLANISEAVRIAGGGRIETVIVLLSKDVALNRGFRFTWKPEYFNGESAYFSESNLKVEYASKARALLNAVWKTGYPAESGVSFPAGAENKKAALGYALSVDLLPLYSHANVAVMGDGPVKRIPYPFPHRLDSVEIATMMRTAKASPYLAAYIRLHYIKQKPLYSKGLAAAEEGLPAYSYADYKAIDSFQGEKLARAALRFLLWGVEYTTPDKLPQRDAFKGCRSDIDVWLGNNLSAVGQTLLSENNYYPVKANAVSLESFSWLSQVEQNYLKSVSFAVLPLNGFAGNPLPYIEGGIDSPRSFAYKLSEQWKTRTVMKPAKSVIPESTRAYKKDIVPPLANSDTIFGYWQFWEEDLKKLPKSGGGLLKIGSVGSQSATVKPFTPFFPQLDKIIKPNIELDMLAGVDAAGFLLGSIAMTDFAGHFCGPGGLRLADNLNEYYSMSAVNKGKPGLDAAGKPLFALPDNSVECLKSGALGAYRIQRPAFERISILVPEFNDIQTGDIAVHFGQADEEFSAKPKIGTDYFHIGIIVKKGASDEDTIVVHMSAGTQRVAITKLSAFDAKNQYHIRRLLIKGAFGQRELNSDWDILDTEPSRILLSLDLSKARPMGERWIPNTGEYREFQIQFSLLNRAGRVIKFTEVSDASFVFQPPVDRGYDAGKDASTGNIYNNQGDGFELVAGSALGRFDTEEALQLITFRNNKNGTYSMEPKTNDKMDKSGNLISGYDWIIAPSGEGLNTVAIQETINKKQTYTVFGIRPIGNTSIKPGDDIVMSVGLRKKLEPGAKPWLESDLAEKDYLAVYDKKMLWRANLYIDEGVEDWNETHPWNAPPSGGATPSSPKWWTSEWGNNEWNRLHDGTVSNPVAITGLNQLPAGDGKQVIKLTSFTPIRTLGNKDNPTSTNIITKTVAYSYPDHEYEPSDGDSGSMDSPFDYNKKMQLQITLLKDWYNATGVAFAKPRSAWPNPNATTTAGFTSWEQYKENVTGTTNQNSIILPAAFVALNASATNWNSNVTLNGVLTRWTKNTPPDNRWWRYLVAAPTGWTDASTTPNTNAFIPSLGLRYGRENLDLDEVAIAGISVNNFLKKKYAIEAGTDCIGFAQRAASYSGNASTWVDLPKGFSEAGAENIWTVLNSYGVLHRHYPSDAGEAQSFPDEEANNVMHNRTQYDAGNYLKTKGTLTDSEKISLLERLRMVVPGDIWVKDTSSTTDPNGGAMREHIAVIAFVPSDSTITDLMVFINQMILIEGEFTNKIQSVIKKLSVGDYNQGNIPSGRSIGYFTTDGVVSLNCQSWAIRRLK